MSQKFDVYFFAETSVLGQKQNIFENDVHCSTAQTSKPMDFSY